MDSPRFHSRPRRWWKAALGALAAAALTGLLLTACSTVTRSVLAPPQIEGATFVGNQACADCHADMVRRFPDSPHARFHKDDAKWAGISGCESCHGPASKHVQSPGRGRFIFNPGKDPAACFNCHLEVHAQFNLPQHHPVIEGRMNCVQCHDPHGREIHKPAGGLAMSRHNESCAQCHRDQARPFVFEHEAMREGCASCHHPHGSPNRKMLLQADNNLCLKCHSQMQGGPPGTLVFGKVDHTTLVAGRSCWSAGCHTAVHGSNISPKLHY